MPMIKLVALVALVLLTLYEGAHGREPPAPAVTLQALRQAFVADRPAYRKYVQPLKLEAVRRVRDCGSPLEAIRALNRAWTVSILGTTNEGERGAFANYVRFINAFYPCP